jgi:DNA-binding NarL/FixJ family response regulator
MTVRVMIVDDDEDIRSSLRMILEAEGDLVVVAEAPNASRAVAVAQRMKPDVAIVDIHMPGRSGVDATAELKALEVPPRVLILTSFANDKTAIAALAAGADGFLLKALRPGELPAAVRAVCEGRNVVAAPVLPSVIERAVTAHQRETQGSGDDLADLTDRERQLMRAVGLGMSNSQIAAELTVTEASAKTFVSRLLDKLGATNRTQLAIMAYRAGLLD